MTRLILTLAVWMTLVSAGWASLTPPKKLPPFGKDLPQIPASKLWAQALEQEAERGAESEFIVTHRTEILLNGKPCRYEEVPGHARILRMEVAADKKTVLKIHFRTRK